MLKTALGIDIGNFNIKVVQVANNNGKNEIVNYAIAKTPEGTINDGKILDPDSIAEAIKEVLVKNSIKVKQTIGIISSTALVTREVSVPKMNEADLTKYVMVDSQQYFPMDLEEYVLDYKVIGEKVKKDGNELNVLLSAIPEVVVNDYIKIFDKLKLDLVAIDIIPNILSKYTENYLNGKQVGSSTYALIDLGADNTIVSIIADGALQFTKMIASGGNEITKNISDSFNLELNEAEEYKLKNAEIILEAYNSEGLAGSISDVIKPTIDNIIAQVNKFFEFYFSRGENSKINGIYLMGGGSLLKGIEKYYQAAFNIPTRKVDMIDGVVDKTNKPNTQKDLPILINAFAVTYRE